MRNKRFRVKLLHTLYGPQLETIGTGSLSGALLEPDFSCSMVRDVLSWLMFFHGVTAFFKPDFGIAYVDEDGQAREFRPDLMVFLENGRPLVWQLGRDHETVKDEEGKWWPRPIRNACADRGWTFDWTYADAPPTPTLQNVRLIWSHAQEPGPAVLACRERILARFVGLWSAQKAFILDGLLDGEEPETLEAAWWSLLADELVIFDTSFVLTAKTHFKVAPPWEPDVIQLPFMDERIHGLQTDELTHIPRPSVVELSTPVWTSLDLPSQKKRRLRGKARREHAMRPSTSVPPSSLP